MKTFRDYLFSRHQSNATVALHEDSVYQFIGWCEDENIEPKHATYSEILSYIKHLKKRGLKQRTVKMHLSALNHYFKWVIETGLRSDHPTAGIEIKGIQRKFLYHILPMVELEAIYPKFIHRENVDLTHLKIWEIQQYYARRVQQVVYGLMIWQGLEVGELKRLTIRDLKLREGTIYIAPSRRSNERTLKLQSIQIMDLMDYLHTVRPWYQHTNPKPTENLFISRNGGEWGNSFMAYTLGFLNQCNPVITSLKQIHASVIVYWLKTNNLRQAQHMAGHRYVSSTEAYLVNDLEDLQEDIAKFHPMG